MVIFFPEDEKETKVKICLKQDWRDFGIQLLVIAVPDTKKGFFFIYASLTGFYGNTNQIVHFLKLRISIPPNIAVPSRMRVLPWKPVVGGIISRLSLTDPNTVVTSDLIVQLDGIIN